MIKRISAACAAVFLCVWLLVPLSAAADHQQLPAISQAGYYQPADYAQYYGFSLDDVYYFCYWGTLDNQYGTLFVYYPKSAYIEYEDETATGVYKVIFNAAALSRSNSQRLTSFTSINEWEDDAHNSIEIPYDCDGFCTRDRNGYDYYDNRYQNWSLTGYKTNMPCFEEGAAGLEFSVTPDLNGVYTRSGSSDGIYYTADTFAVTVDNIGDVDMMYCWAIVPHNTNFLPYYSAPQYHDYKKAVDEKRFYNTAPTFLYFCDEWVNIPAGINDSTFATVLTPSSWHKIPAGGHVDTFVQFNQVNLRAGFEYDLVGFGVPLADGGVYATYLDSYYFPGMTAVDFVSDTQQYYSSTFTITDPATFDSSNRGFGSYAWDDEQLYKNTDWTMKTYGFKDEEGNTVIQENKTTDFNLSAHPAQGFDYNSGGRNKFDSLTSSTDNFFAACARVLSYFPADCYMILSLGLAALVAIAIFKGVIK